MLQCQNKSLSFLNFAFHLANPRTHIACSFQVEFLFASGLVQSCHFGLQMFVVYQSLFDKFEVLRILQTNRTLSFNFLQKLPWKSLGRSQWALTVSGTKDFESHRSVSHQQNFIRYIFNIFALAQTHFQFGQLLDFFGFEVPKSVQSFI